MGKRLEHMPIIISPKYSRATWLTNMAADHYYEWVRARGFNPIRIGGFKCRRLFLRKEKLFFKMHPKPLAIFYFGHGEPDAWIGAEGLNARLFRRRLVKMGENANWLDQDAIIYTISCHTMKKLGPYLVQGKVRTYLGSTNKMLVHPIDNRIWPKALPNFIDIFTIGQKQIALGATTGEALVSYYARCNYYLKKYEESGLLDKSQQIRNAYAGILLNRNYFSGIGDMHAQWITDEELAPILKRSKLAKEMVEDTEVDESEVYYDD